jgi:hypothetical protein
MLFFIKGICLEIIQFKSLFLCPESRAKFPITGTALIQNIKATNTK